MKPKNVFLEIEVLLNIFSFVIIGVGHSPILNKNFLQLHLIIIITTK